jgi:hypothetical protein
MSKYRKIPVVIEATQWFKNGDHPEDGTEAGELYEGKVVRRFARHDIPHDHICRECNLPYAVHGWINTLEGGHRVCPGDWIITGVKGERYPCKADIFAMTYELVEE